MLGALEPAFGARAGPGGIDCAVLQIKGAICRRWLDEGLEQQRNDEWR